MALHYKKQGNIEAARGMLGTSKSMQAPIDTLLSGQTIPNFVLPPPPSAVAAAAKKHLETQVLLCQRLAGFHLRFDTCLFLFNLGLGGKNKHCLCIN